MAEVEIPNVEELEEIKVDTFTKRVALVTAIFAVCLAITSLGGSNAMKEMILAQQQASDQWAFYQAKVIREHLYRGQKLRLELDLLERGDAIKPEAKAKWEAMLKKLTEEEKRYGEEKRDIEKEARAFERERDLNRSKDPYFDYAEVLLQIAIVLSSIAILAHSRTVFVCACVAAGLGILLSINGFLLLVQIPFLQ
ncbi:MAG: DUF4337 domain-containing protein [Deltaproteobacteria bacterium]|nr:DUF4337 domain-containing protein [Deltaproteobacteria bacterium]